LEYKIIIKELLFNGADRKALNLDGKTALMILEENKSVFSQAKL
jgi:hypothetical protein